MFKVSVWKRETVCMWEKAGLKKQQRDYPWISSYSTLKQNEITSFIKVCYTPILFLESEKQNTTVFSLELMQK